MIEWLIDIIKEWVGAQGFLQTGFVDRGDPAANDFTITNFIRDGAWHDLDLSGIIPENVKAVAISFAGYNTEASKHVWMKTKGNIKDFNKSQFFTQTAGLVFTGDMIVAPNENGIIEYQIESTGWLYINITVKGWWF